MNFRFNLNINSYPFLEKYNLVKLQNLLYILLFPSGDADWVSVSIPL